MVMGLDCAWPDKSSIPPGNVVRNIDAGIIVEQVIPCCPKCKAPEKDTQPLRNQVGLLVFDNGYSYIDNALFSSNFPKS